MAGRTFSFEVNRTSSAPAAILFRLATEWWTLGGLGEAAHPAVELGAAG